MIFTKKKKVAEEPSEIVDKVTDEVQNDNLNLKSIVLQKYMSKNQFSDPKKLVKSSIRLHSVVLVMYFFALVFCLMAISEIWVKNSDVGLYVQRIDGVKVNIVNDARSKILLRKALQNGLTRDQIKQLNLE